MRLMDFYNNGAAATVSADKTRISRSPLVLPALTLVILDTLGLWLAGLVASYATIFGETMLGRPAYTDIDDGGAVRGNVFLLLGLCCLVMFWSKGLYSKRVPWWSQIQYIAKVIVFVLLVDGFISFAFRFYESRLLIAGTWAAALGAIVALRYAGCALASRLGVWKIPAVLIGDAMTVTDLVYAFHADRCAGYDVHTIFLRDREQDAFDITNLPRACRHIRVNDSVAGYEAYIRQNPHQFYIVSLDAFRGETRERLLASLEDIKANYAIVPAIANTGVYDMEPHYFFGHDIMLLQRRNAGMAVQGAQLARLVKRGFDMAVSGSLLLAVLPVILAVGTALKLEGQGGSLFYGGTRIGKNGRAFKCWKFRSMQPDSDHLLHARLDNDPAARAQWEKYRKLADDPRVTTKTARLIRKLSIDELPQLWNVLSGDMSLVGPRPILEEEIPYFGDRLKDYTAVRPGVTGLWQVSGRNATSFMRRVHWDSWYVRNWSLWGDLVILIKTPFVLLTGSGAH